MNINKVVRHYKDFILRKGVIPKGRQRRFSVSYDGKIKEIPQGRITS